MNPRVPFQIQQARKRRMDALKAMIRAAYGLRFDANETAMLTRETLFVRAQTADVLYAPSEARRFIPIKSPPAPIGAASVSYKQFDRVGMAKLVGNYATDWPRVDLLVKEYPRKIESVGASYGWSVQDMRAAAFAGLSLDQMKAMIARDVIERRLDQLASTGIAGLTSVWAGFINNANIPLVTPPIGNWATATPLEINADVLAFCNSIVETSKTVHKPTDMLVPPSLYSLLLQPMSTAQPDKTVLRYILDNNPYIKTIEQWTRLENADVAGTGPRVIVYAKNETWVYQELVIEFEQFAPQLEHQDYVTDCHARTGGTVIPYPLSMAAADGC